MLIDVDKFYLQVIASNEPCEKHKHKSSCSESQLCLKVKRFWKPKELATFRNLFDKYQITLFANLRTNERVSEWVLINRDSWQEILLWSDLLNPQRDWLHSNKIRILN